MPVIKRTLQAGFTLIEVLISMAILAVGLLGMTALQNEALKYNFSAFTESQAMFLINDMVERIRANSDSSTYGIEFIEDPATPGVDCLTASCNSAQMTEWDLDEWRTMVEDPDYLPEGESAIIFDPVSREYTISIRYDWSSLGGVDLTGGLRTISVTTRI